MDGDETVLNSIGTGRLAITSNTRERQHSVLGRRTTSIRRMSISESATANLSFDNINYIVGTRTESSQRCLKLPGLPFRKPREPKQILFNVSGQFSNGVNAILGKVPLIFLCEIYFDFHMQRPFGMWQIIIT